MQAQIHAGAQGMRPRIDFFHQRLNGSSEFANQYAMNFNAMRPPSRHKDPPQNQGLELPPEAEEDIPSLDEDSDSQDEFEMGIQNAAQVQQPVERPAPLEEARGPQRMARLLWGAMAAPP